MPPSPQSAPLDVIDHALSALSVGEGRTHRGLTLFPLLADRDTSPAYDTFSTALAAGTFRVTEVTESGVVGRLRAVNQGARPVLLLDGEEVIGAKQNRVFNLTIIVPAMTELDLPVSCVEQGRWHAQSQAFHEADRAMFARGRANKVRNVTVSMRERGDRGGDQGAVWQDVAAHLRVKGVHSSTFAMADAYATNRASIGEYVERFAPEPRQVGAAFALEGDVIGLEFFDSPAAYRAAAAKVIRSYAAELAGREVADAAADRAAALALIEQVRRTPATRHPALGLGEDIRFERDPLVGAALALDQQVIHFFAFRTSPAAEPPRPRRERTLAQDLVRDGVLRCNDARTFETPPPPVARSRGGLRDRIHGMLLGLAIGDALGNTTEGMLPAERRAHYGEIRDYLPDPQTGERAGLPSDDTQLAFWALDRLLQDDGLNPERLARAFRSGHIHGIGSAVRAALRVLAAGEPWHRAGQPSAGNGALMRIAPVLLPHLRDPSPRLWSDAAVAGMITHNEPASVGACVAFTSLLWRLLATRERPQPGWYLHTFVETLREVEGDVPRYAPRAPHLSGQWSLASFAQRQVGAALAERRECAAVLNGWYSGAYLLETVPAVLYILERYGHDPAEAIVRAVNDTKDNDTIAAIVGAAVGAQHGLGALPQHWVRGLRGRTRDADDGEVFRLAAAAADRFTPGD